MLRHLQAFALVGIVVASALGAAQGGAPPPSPGKAPLSAQPLPFFHNYSAFSGLSANASILPPAVIDAERSRDMLNGGRGACWFDYDLDGDDDLYVVGPGKSQLFRNDGGWNFTEVTDAAGLGVLGYGMGCGAADLDRDGDDDLWVTYFDSPMAVFRNNGNGTFTNVTAASGVQGVGAWTGVSFGDFDNDGLLDVFVTAYVRQQDRIYRNLGNLSFEERWNSSRMYDLDWGFQALIFDYDLDGDVDIYVINDFGVDRMWRNDGGWNFTDVSFETGANDRRGGMGGDVADYNHDGALDFFVTNFEANGLYAHNGSAFEDRAQAAHVDNWSTGWAAAFVDFNNDGWDDLFVVNGVVDSPSPEWQSNILYENLGNGTFKDVSAGSGVESNQIGRSLALADVDGDGRVDFYVTNVNSPNEMLRNVYNTTNGWLGMRLQGTVSNPHGVGALITVRAGNSTWVKPVLLGSGYLSTNSKELHFGLGAAPAVDSIEVRWPSGLVQTIGATPVNSTLVIRESDGEAPVAGAPNLTVLKGVPFVLDGSNSTDNVRIATWNWSVDDNGTARTAKGKTAAMALYTAGNFTGALTVADTFGNTASTSFAVEVQPFVGVWADAGRDAAVDEGQTFAFAAAGGTSESPDFENTSTFTWSFTEGASPVVLTGARPSHVFTQVGTVEVRLDVVDLKGNRVSDFLNVTVLDVTSPTVRWSVPAAADEDQPVGFDASASSDNDPQFPGGATFEWSYLGHSGPVVFSGINTTHVFADPGQVSVTLRVFDSAGNGASAAFALTVRDTTPPVADAGPDRTALPGESIELSAAASTDNAFDFFQNGTFDWAVPLRTGTVHLLGPTQSIAFPEPGVYVVELHVSDPGGNPSALPGSLTVTVVDDEPPAPNGGGNRQVGVGVPVVLNGSASADNDPSLLSTGRFSWEFQDGAVRQTLSGAVAAYTFTQLGAYRIRLSVFDAAGNSAAIVFTITVVDTTPPALNVTAPSAQIEAGASLLLNASGTTDNIAVASISWRVTGPFGFDISIANGSGAVLIALPGNYTATVRALDTAGNQVTRSFEVKVVPASTTGGADGNHPPGGPDQGGGSTSGPGLGALAVALAVGAAGGIGAALFVLRKRREGPKPPQAE
jgi:enediyne biosynthesis protein E4